MPTKPWRSQGSGRSVRARGWRGTSSTPLATPSARSCGQPLPVAAAPSGHIDGSAGRPAPSRRLSGCTAERANHAGCVLGPFNQNWLLDERRSGATRVSVDRGLFPSSVRRKDIVVVERVLDGLWIHHTTPPQPQMEQTLTPSFTCG
jgi:hypothetical protein